LDEVHKEVNRHILLILKLKSNYLN